MRTHRKRKWSSLTVNMIPLINVIFLINIFIIMMFNFSEVLIKRVTLPKADEAKQSTEQLIQKILVTVKSEDVLFLGRTRVTLDNLEYAIRQTVSYHQGSTVQLRGEENVTYDVVEKVSTLARFHVHAGQRGLDDHAGSRDLAPLDGNPEPRVRATPTAEAEQKVRATLVEQRAVELFELRCDLRCEP